ncbi:hypothetical protein KR009_011009 [Drosophila setifemur]|nr:hypothetical protein KR009_011009 [Drosophila setifemur]
MLVLLAAELPEIPSSCYQDVAATFLDQIDLGKYTTLAKVRELWEYLHKAFRNLVGAEWESLNRIDKENRAIKARQMQDTAAMMDRVIVSINKMLADTNDENVLAQLKKMDLSFRSNATILEDNLQDIIVPQISRTSASLRRSSRPRNSRGTGGKGGSTSEMEIKDLFMNVRKNCDENQDTVVFGTVTAEEVVPPTEPLSPTYGLSRFQNYVSEDFISMREPRSIRFRNPQLLRERLPWPVPPLQTWLDHSFAPHFDLTFIEVRRRVVIPPITAHEVENSASSILQQVRQQRSQDQETPEAAYFNRFEPTGDDEGVWSSDAIGRCAAAFSTPITQSTGHGFYIQTLANEDGTGLPTPFAPSLPEEFAMGSDVEGSSLVLSANNEETALVGASASASVSAVRSRHGVTPASTLSFRPLLPAIDEEQQQQNPYRRRLTTLPRMLELSDTSPPQPGADKSLASNIENPPSPKRDWASAFRVRENLINYVEVRTPATRRPRRRLRRPHGDSDALSAQGEIQGAQQLPSSSDDIVTTFMANLLTRSTAVVEASQQLVRQPAELDYSDSAKMHTVLERSEPGPEDYPIGVNTDLVGHQTSSPLTPAPLEPDTFKDLFAPILPAAFTNSTVVQDKNPELLAIVNMLDISDPDLDHIVHKEFNNAPLNETNPLTDLSDHAHVTNVQIISGPSISETFGNNTVTTSLLNEMVDRAISLTTSQGTGTELVKIPSVQELREGKDTQLYRDSMDGLAFIVQHRDELRHMIDRQRDLSVQRQSMIMSDDSDETNMPDSMSMSDYVSMPAVNVYDPTIITNMSKEKFCMVNGLLEALIKQPHVDIHKTSFIRNRMDAAITFRILLELKMHNIVHLSKEGRIFSLL